MAQVALVPPDNHTKAPTTRDENAESGNSFKRTIDAINAMLTELYNSIAGIVAYNTAGRVSAKYTKNVTAGATTAAAGDLTGAVNVNAEFSAVGAANLTTRTAAQMFADAGAIAGQSYELAIMNSSAGVTTLVGGTGVTITGTATVSAGAMRFYAITFNTATTMTFQNIGSGTI